MATASPSYFQGGDFVELLNAQGKAPASTWKLQGKIAKSFDKSIKGNAFLMDGSSETKMQLPKTPSTSNASSLGLTQRFVIFQLLVSHTRSFSLELGFADFQKIRRRFVFASAFRETTTTALHVQIPMTNVVPRDQWMNLVFDLHALAEQFFPGSSFRSMESICISGTCRLKRIFTMKDAPNCPALADKLQAQLVQYKMQRAQSPGSSPPIAVGSFADMKEIPKQFVFSVGSSCLPIPTEYFLPASDIDASVNSAPPASAAQATRVTGGKTSTGDVKGSKSASSGTGTKKPKSAGLVTNGSRPVVAKAAREEQPTLTSAKDQSRVRSAPSIQRTLPVSDGSPSRRDRPIKTSEKVKSPVRDKSLPPPSSRRLHEATSEARILSGSRQQDASLSSSCEWGSDDEDLADKLHSDQDDDHDDIYCPSPDASPVRSLQTSRVSAPPCDRDTSQLEMRTRASSERKQHRQNVIAEIQSKLDALTKEAEEEDERDRSVLLKHTHLTRSALYSADEASPVVQKSKQLDLFTSTGAIDSLHQSWRENEMLRSPEPMILQRMQATKKPAIAFSSSIFRFGREMETSTDNATSTSSQQKQLFDWESLLGESIASVPELSSASSREEEKRQLNEPLPNAPTLNSRKPFVVAKPQVEDNEVASTKLNDTTEQHSIRPPTALASSPNQSKSREDEDEFQSSFDFSMSPMPFRSNPSHHEHILADNRDEHPETSSPRGGSEDSVSIDLTDDLDTISPPSECDDDEGSDIGIVRQTSHQSEDEEEGSFDFDELVVRDRDFESPVSASSIKQQDPRVSTKTDRPQTESMRPSTATDAPSKLVERTPTRSTLRASTTASPSKIRDTRKAQPVEVAPLSVSGDESPSSHRRLASLLESTDWSQLPLSSVVSRKNRPSSPVRSTPRKNSSETKPTSRSSRATSSSSSIELIYDPILRCYYDPIGKKYYALAK